jgi:PTS system nitrogen regulatory IIA component
MARLSVMVIGDFLAPSDVLLDMAASDKTRLLRDLANHAASATGLRGGTIAAELLKRETLGSTGIGGGVAIPHAKVTGLNRAHGILARLREPIDFGAIDGAPVDIVFVLLLPATNDGLDALACVARKLRDQTALAEIKDASNPVTLHRVATT